MTPPTFSSLSPEDQQRLETDFDTDQDAVHLGWLPFQLALRKNQNDTGTGFDRDFFLRMLGEGEINTRSEDDYPAHSFCGYPLAQFPLLLELGYDFSMVDPEGETALHVLVRDVSASEDVVVLLSNMISAGLDPEAGVSRLEHPYLTYNSEGEDEWAPLIAKARVLRLEAALPKASPAPSRTRL